MLLILKLLGWCKSQNLQWSCCLFCIYTYPAVKIKNLQHDSRYTCKPIKDFDSGRSMSTDVNIKYQQQQTNYLNSLALFK